MSANKLNTDPDLVDRFRGQAVITIPEAADLLNLKRTATYEAVRRGQLPSLRLGRRLFIPVPALLRLLGETGTNGGS